MDLVGVWGGVSEYCTIMTESMMGLMARVSRHRSIHSIDMVCRSVLWYRRLAVRAPCGPADRIMDNEVQYPSCLILTACLVNDFFPR